MFLFLKTLEGPLKKPSAGKRGDEYLGYSLLKWSCRNHFSNLYKLFDIFKFIYFFSYQQVYILLFVTSGLL